MIKWCFLEKFNVLDANVDKLERKVAVAARLGLTLNATFRPQKLYSKLLILFKNLFSFQLFLQFLQ